MARGTCSECGQTHGGHFTGCPDDVADDRELEPVDCKHCHGTGRIYTDPRGSSQNYRCTDCDGTGRIQPDTLNNNEQHDEENEKDSQ